MLEKFHVGDISSLTYFMLLRHVGILHFCGTSCMGCFVFGQLCDWDTSCLGYFTSGIFPAKDISSSRYFMFGTFYAWDTSFWGCFKFEMLHIRVTPCAGCLMCGLLLVQNTYVHVCLGGFVLDISFMLEIFHAQDISCWGYFVLELLLDRHIIC